MLDLSNKLEVYFITNGRSTSEYALAALHAQKYVQFKIVIHRDMDWLSANKRILEVCTSKFFMRVDDDMILNPHAVRYMWHCVEKQSSRIALKGCKLWEPYSSKVVKGVKAYNLRLAREIGFKISKIGKIDKIFSADAKRKRKKISYTNDVIGIHACSNFKEHLKYAIMRGEDKGSGFSTERAWMKHHINKFNVPLPKQAKMADKFVRRLNKRKRTGFFRFLREHPHPNVEPEQSQENE